MVLSIFPIMIIDITILTRSTWGLKDGFIDIDVCFVPTVWVRRNQFKCSNHA